MNFSCFFGLYGLFGFCWLFGFYGLFGFSWLLASVAFLGILASSDFLVFVGICWLLLAFWFLWFWLLLAFDSVGKELYIYMELLALGLRWLKVIFACSSGCCGCCCCVAGGGGGGGGSSRGCMPGRHCALPPTPLQL